MADNDFSAQFEKISDISKTATDTLRAAGDKARDKLAADAAAAGEKAAAAANRFKDKADGDREKVSSQWQDIRDKWQAHVAKVRRNVKEHKERFDAHEAATDADMAEAYAFDAIDFAQGALEEAKSAASMPRTCEPARTRSVADFGRGPQACCRIIARRLGKPALCQSFPAIVSGAATLVPSAP